MQLVETASAKAEELIAGFYCSVSCCGPQPQWLSRECRKAFRGKVFKFPKCRAVSKNLLSESYTLLYIDSYDIIF